jgi:hypothetical protein
MFEDGPANVIADIQQLVGFENRFHGGHFILLMAWANRHWLKRQAGQFADMGNSGAQGRRRPPDANRTALSSRRCSSQLARFSGHAFVPLAFVLLECRLRVPLLRPPRPP